MVGLMPACQILVRAFNERPAPALLWLVVVITYGVGECIFCGGSANSREHIIAKRLVRRMGFDTRPIRVGRFHETEGLPIARPAHKLNELVTRDVCRGCNHGWMNDLEAWFESRLGYLIEPEWPRLAEEMLREVVKEREKLTRWILKTAMAVDRNGMLRHRLFRSEQTRAAKDGPLPSDLFLDMAHARTPELVCRSGRGFPVYNGGLFQPNGEFQGGTGFRFTIQMNHLLLRAVRVPQAQVGYRPSANPPIRVWPEPSSFGADSAPYSYADIVEFEEAFFLMTYRPRSIGTRD
jgi:hypothetical protein